MKNRNDPTLAAGSSPNSWTPATGYKWANPSNQNDLTVVPK
jgi:hypothetical protein